MGVQSSESLLERDRSCFCSSFETSARWISFQGQTALRNHSVGNVHRISINIPEFSHHHLYKTISSHIKPYQTIVNLVHLSKNYVKSLVVNHLVKNVGFSMAGILKKTELRTGLAFAVRLRASAGSAICCGSSEMPRRRIAVDQIDIGRLNWDK